MGDRDTREQRLALTVYQFAVIAPVLVGLHVEIQADDWKRTGVEGGEAVELG